MNQTSPITSIHRILTLAILFLAFIFSSWQCFEAPEDPVMPTWTTQLSIPLMDTIFYLNDALKDNPDIIISGTHYEYHPEQFKFDSLSIGDKLQLNPDPSLTIEQSIGTFSVNMNQAIQSNVSASTIWGTVPPDPTPVPEFYWEDSVILSGINEFEYVHFASGSLKLEIRNSLPVPLELYDGIYLVNRTLPEDIVASFPSVTIQPNTTWSPPLSSLQNKFVRNVLKSYLKVRVVGSGGNSVVVHPDSGISLSLQVMNGVADELRAETFERIDYSTVFRPYVFDDSTYFEQIILKRGKLRLQVENTLQIGVTAAIRMDEMINIETGESFLIDVPLNAGSTLTYNYDLTEWRFEALNGLSNTATCSLRVSSNTLGSGTPVTLHSNDKVRVTLFSEDTPFMIKRVSGVSKPILLDINDTVDLDVGKFSSNFSADSVVLDSITMKLNIFSAVGHPIDLTVQCRGLNSSGGIISTMNIIPGGSPNGNAFRLTPSQHEQIQFTNLSRFVSDFLTHRGTRIILRGSALVNPYDVYATKQVGTVEDTTNFYSSLDVNAIMSFGIFNGVFSDTVDFDDEGEDKIDKDVITKIKQASVFFKIENAIPMGVNLETSFENNVNTTVLNLPKAGDPDIGILAGTPAVPRVTTTPIRIGISPDDADKFNDAKQIIVRLNLNSGNLLTPFTTSDYIRVRAYANIVFEVNSK